MQHRVSGLNGRVHRRNSPLQMRGEQRLANERSALLGAPNLVCEQIVALLGIFQKSCRKKYHTRSPDSDSLNKKNGRVTRYLGLTTRLSTLIRIATFVRQVVSGVRRSSALI